MKRLGPLSFANELTLAVLLMLGVATTVSQSAAENSSASGGGKKSAPDPAKLWAFQPLREVTVPSPKTKGWVRNPIDAFILASLERNHLKPAPAASSLTLLRRAHFDLTGLPPKPEEVQAMLAGGPSKAFAGLVDDLLASPQYGERWARHWLDVVRYAETSGFETDLPFRNAWQYRDYVIRAFNSNKPLNRFVLEQVAGDELWPGDPDALVATGLYAVGPASVDSALTSTQLEYEWLT